jgi:hypothetical protein
MKRLIAFFIVIIFTCIFITPAKAELYDRGGGLIYDNILDITWLQNANYSGNTMTWIEANDWAEMLIFQGYDDWRLPGSDTSCSGYDCMASEMGHIYYIYNITSDSTGLFTDVNPFMYWSGSEYDNDTSKAWRFHFGSGYQGTSSKTYTRYAWALRDGDSTPATPVVPEPVSSILFVSGGAIMAVRRCWKKQEKA